MSIEKEYRKVSRLLAGTPFAESFREPASEADLQELEVITKISVFGGLKDLWLMANGTEYRLYGTPAFCAYTDGFVPCGFYSVQEAIAKWQDPFLEEDFEGIEENPPRHRNINSGWVNSRWLPFAEFDGGSTILYYDADPSPRGQIGQIIAYQHDPEAIHFISSTFIEFFKKSNFFLRWAPPMRAWRRGE